MRTMHLFSRVYSLQAAGSSWPHSRALWSALRLASLTQLTLSRYLSEHSHKWGIRLISARYVAEVAAAMTRVNYNQSPDTISALAGLIGMAPDSSTFTIQGGTSQLPTGLLERSGAEVQERTRVTRVARRGEGVGWVVEVKRADGVTETLEFDAVIIAAPLATARIKVEGAPDGWPPAQKYQTVYSTFIKGRFQMPYFGAKYDADIPAFVGTSQGSDAPFSSISTLEANNRTRLVKVFSIGDPRDTVLDTVFEPGATILAEKRWLAYPHYSPPEALGPFRVANGLYYLNAIEAGGSCIEISAISGVNAAYLLQDEWGASDLLRSATIRQASLRIEEDL
jgi:prenylcysteine oxidase / farnesylcysteine lyase